jgi:hypothetical protein
MSATGRGSEREARDFYPTPESAFAPLLPHLPRFVKIWEPACGDGRLIKMMMSARDVIAMGNDLAHGYDFLRDETARECIVTNPPFSCAFDFCRRAVELSPRVFMLLPLPFLASATRRPWFRANEPAALYVLSERPSFVVGCKCLRNDCRHRWTLPAGSPAPKRCAACAHDEITITRTDATDYAWFHWDRTGASPRGIFHL